MQGDYTYCMKHGHKFARRWEIVEKTGMLVWECDICGARQVYWL